MSDDKVEKTNVEATVNNATGSEPLQDAVGVDPAATQAQLRRGLTWTTMNQVGRLTLQFGTQIALTRLLSPHAFGLAAMAMVISGFATVFAESGVRAAVVQRETLTRQLLSSAFAVNAAMSVAMAAVVVLIAPFAADFYGEEDVRWLLWLLAPSLFMSGITAVHRGLLEREMRFKAIAHVELFCNLVGAVVAIAMAVAGAGAVSIVFNTLVANSLASIGYCALTKWFPQGKPSRGDMRDLLGFSSHVMGFNAINYWARNLDNLLVGRYLGPVDAGLYTRSYTLLRLPVQQVSGIFGRVMFPSLSAQQSDKAVVREMYLKAIKQIASVSWFPLALMAAVSPDAIPVLLGGQWSDATALISVFCLIGVMQVIQTTIGWIYLSQGESKAMFRWGLLNSGAYAISFVIGVMIGTPLAVAVSYAVAFVATSPPTLILAYRLVDLKLSTALWTLRQPFVAASSGALAALIISFVLPDWASIFRLAVETAVGGLTFLLAAMWLKLPLVSKVVRKALRRPSPKTTKD